MKLIYLAEKQSYQLTLSEDELEGLEVVTETAGDVYEAYDAMDTVGGRWVRSWRENT